MYGKTTYAKKNSYAYCQIKFVYFSDLVYSW